MRWGTSIVDQHRSCPQGQPAVRVDDTDINQLHAAGELDAHLRRERLGRRLAHLAAKLQAIDHTEQGRAAWITHAREILVRGLAAAQVLAERQQQRIEQQHDGAGRTGAGPAPAAVRGGRAPLGTRS